MEIAYKAKDIYKAYKLSCWPGSLRAGLTQFKLYLQKPELARKSSAYSPKQRKN